MLQLGSFKLEFSHDDGFRLRSFSDVFADSSYLELQSSFKNIDWEEKITPFYSQYRSHVLPSHKHALAKLFAPGFFFPFKAKAEAILGVRFQNKIRVMAHRLITSHEIGIHNDYADPEAGNENFRFIFQFAKPGELASGGELSFWASRYTGEEIRRCPYSSNQAICFEITQRSFHSVAAVDGERHTAVMYLWEEGRAYNGSGVEIK